MTLGEKLKQIRLEKGLSQPDLANATGIEQSYLSKLENDKSLPSNDVFRKILLALQIDIESLISDESLKQDLSRLRQIPDIDNHLNGKAQQTFSKRRQLLTLASAAIVVAITLFYVGYSKLVFHEFVHVYESVGVIKEDEPRDVFYRWTQYYVDPLLTADERSKVIDVMGLEMAKRRIDDIIMSREYRGPEFAEQVEGGIRVYRLDSSASKKIPRAINAWLQVLGVLLLSSGVMGFILERRLFK